LYVFIAAALVLGYVLLAMVALLHVLKELLARPCPPAPWDSKCEEHQEGELSGADKTDLTGG